jgi:hypothetical protein
MGYAKRESLKAIEDGQTPRLIPLNDSMTYDEKREFIHEYLVASEDRETAELERLITAIQNGENISVTYKRED